MSDEESLTPPSHQNRLAKSSLSEEQAYEVARRVRVASMSLDRIYSLIRESAVKLEMPGERGNEFDEQHRQVQLLFGISGKELLDGQYIPIGEQRPQKRRLTARKLLPWGKKAEGESETLTPEIVSHVTPEDVRATAAAGAESAIMLCGSLITNILENYEYHQNRWKTELRRRDLSHPKEMLEHLLITYVGLGGTPDERMVQAIAARTGIEEDKWNKLVQRCLEDNAQKLKAESVLDLLSPLGPPKLGRGGPS